MASVSRGKVVLLVVAGVLLLGAVAALPVILAVRGRALSSRFHAFLAEHFQARLDCPVAEPFVEPAVSVWDCYDGRLDGAHPITLIVGFEPGSRVEVANYLGVYLPPPIGDDWLAVWRARVAARGDWWAARTGAPTRHHIFFGPSEREPIRADRTDDGGAIVAWKLTTLATREKVEARLAELAASFRASP